ncbi:hypothetical protein [Desulfobulbus sp.]|uniref:hypothetical protein n=1 Tax=Desulfobulbus sp. TaxID=895 RepID=UPI00286EC3F3|nr:hypothetical protein [Desulfobulbus sp.]
MDRLVRTVKATEHLDLLVYEGTEDAGGYITIRHNAPIADLEGQVIVPPADIPDLVKSLVSAALELYVRGGYRLGEKDGLGG